MAKMVDFATVTRPIVPATQEAIRADLKSRYLDNGWVLFDTHYMGVVGPEVMMAYVFVKYEDAPEPLEALSGELVSRKRGRPAKVEAPVSVEG